MYSSLADLVIDTSSDNEILDELQATPYQNVCFSMEDIFLAQKKPKSLSSNVVLGSREMSREIKTGKGKISIKKGNHKKALPTNVVKPTFRQSYHDMIDLNGQLFKTEYNKNFAYRVSKM